MKLSLITFETKSEKPYKLIPKGKYASDLAKACVKLAEIYSRLDAGFITKLNTEQ